MKKMNIHKRARLGGIGARGEPQKFVHSGRKVKQRRGENNGRGQEDMADQMWVTCENV